MHGNTRYPRWAGPLVGASLGASVGLRLSLKQFGRPSWRFIGVGALIGCAFGVLVWALDRPAPPVSSLEDELDGLPAHWPHVDQAPPGRLVGRFLALLSMLLFVVPIIGLLLSFAAVLANRRTQGWSLAISRVCVMLAVVTNLALLTLMLVSAR